MLHYIEGIIPRVSLQIIKANIARYLFLSTNHVLASDSCHSVAVLCYSCISLQLPERRDHPFSAPLRATKARVAS